MNHLSDTVLEQIKERHIKQLPKWHFVLRQVGFWCLCILSIVAGALSLSYMAFLLDTSDVFGGIHVYEWASFLWIPVLWIVFLVLFIVVAVWGIEHTARAYKVRLTFWILLNLSLTVIFGITFTLLSVPASFEEIVTNTAQPLSATEFQRRIWERPHDGLLQGKIQRLDAEEMLLELRGGEQWYVFLGRLQMPKDRLSLSEGMLIRVLGEKTGENTMNARSIMPMRVPLEPAFRPHSGGRPPFPMEVRK